MQFNRNQSEKPLYNPFTDNKNKLQNNSTITIQSNKSNDDTFVLNTVTTTILALSRPPSALPNFVDTCSLSSNNNISFHINTKIPASANPLQTFYQSHTAPNICPSASLFSSCSVPTVNPMNPPPVNTQNYTVPFIASNKSLKNFVGLDHQ